MSDLSHQGHGQRPFSVFLLQEGVLRGLQERLLRLKPALRFKPGELTIVPPDLKTLDPIMGRDILLGRYVFAGREVTCRNQSPFAILPPSFGWFEELHGFDWLRHLRALSTPEAQAKARTLFLQWHKDKNTPASWALPIASRRLIAWLSHAPVLLKDADDTFYELFIQMVAAHVRHLCRYRTSLPQSRGRLQVEVAKAFAMLCLTGLESKEKAFSRQLSQALSAQILVDGVHVSRNPQANLDLLADLLPLRQSYSARQIAPPQELVTAIDRLMPMLRFFRLGDGRLSRFHGATTLPGDLLATLLAYDETKGKPVRSATEGGYDRLVAGQTRLLVDAGNTPPRAVSRTAHASCAAFEMTDGTSPLIINCGAGPKDRPEWRYESRQTRNHSTLTIENSSSCSFLKPGLSRGMLGPIVRHGAQVTSRIREVTPEGEKLVVVHNGYVRSYGLKHARTLLLASDGAQLDGRDGLEGPQGQKPHEFELHFHVHPSVEARELETGKGIVLKTAHGSRWIFSADIKPVLVDSLFFPGWQSPRPAKQIIVKAIWPETDEIFWRLEKVA